MCDFQQPASSIRRQTGLSDANSQHFTLPAIKTANKEVAGYIHCTFSKEKKALNISHIKVARRNQLSSQLVESRVMHHDLFNCSLCLLSLEAFGGLGQKVQSYI